MTVRFGNVTARHVVPFGTEEGVRAVFSEMPSVGSTLFIGYLSEPLDETKFKFVEPGDGPVA